MASFELKREDTGIIYTLNVGEFVFRNTYGVNSVGSVTSLEPTGYTSITVLGDNIIEKLGRDAIESGVKFYFVNHPNYYLKIERSPLSNLGTQQRYQDPSNNTNIIINSYTNYYSSFNVYKDNDVRVTVFMGYNKVMFSSTGTDPVLAVNNLPNFALTNEPFFNPHFAFNFSQKQVAIISPYYYNIQSFEFDYTPYPSNATQIRYGNNSPVYIGKPFTLKNGVANNALSDLYDYNTNQPFIYSDIKSYGDLANKNLIGSVGSTIGNIHSTITMQLKTYTSNIDGKLPYDFWYWLLMDTDSEDNPYPDNPDNKDPSGQSKPNTGGNGNNPSGGNPNSDIIYNPSLPTVNPISTGSVNLYQMDATTFRAFMSYLWSNPFYTAFIKLFQDPMQAVISTHIIGISVPTVRKENITIGNVTTDVQANVVGNNFVRANFSYLQIPEFYADASDYLETVVELYLPYHGYVTLNTFEVMGAKINLEYTIDVLTGSFVAVVTVSKTIDDTTLNSVLYQYNGNMAYQIPLSSVDYSSYITATLGAIGALTQKRIGSIVGGLVDSALSIDIGYDRASTLTANTGYMSVKEAYVTILRPIHAQAPNFAHYVGYPYEGYVTLGSCSGLTICREVYINNVLGTDEETKEIKSLLMEGVIL